VTRTEHAAIESPRPVASAAGTGGDTPASRIVAPSAWRVSSSAPVFRRVERRARRCPVSTAWGGMRDEKSGRTACIAPIAVLPIHLTTRPWAAPAPYDAFCVKGTSPECAASLPWDVAVPARSGRSSPPCASLAAVLSRRSSCGAELAAHLPDDATMAGMKGRRRCSPCGGHAPHVRRLPPVPGRWAPARAHRRGALRDAQSEHAASANWWAGCTRRSSSICRITLTRASLSGAVRCRLRSPRRGRADLLFIAADQGEILTEEHVTGRAGHRDRGGVGWHPEG